MAPFLILVLTLAAADPDLPIGRDTIVAPPPQPTAASAALPAAAPVAPVGPQPGQSLAPTDDYGYVAFCYGAESTYLGLYDQVMPQVERIERAFPGPTPIDQAMAEYPQLRTDSQAHIATYAKALAAAEAASAQPIAQTGVQAIELGRSTWDVVAKAAPAAAAEAWMGWSPEDACTTRAQALIQRAQPLATNAGAGPGAVELDKLAAPVLAAAPVASLQTTALNSPASLAPAAPAAPPITFGAAPLAVSFANTATPASAAPDPISSTAPPLPGQLPALATPPAASAPQSAPWRGVL